MKEIFSDIAISTISVLITLIAIYLSVRLLGKLAKFVIGVVIVAFLVWLFVSDNSILSTIMSKF